MFCTHSCTKISRIPQLYFSLLPTPDFAFYGCSVNSLFFSIRTETQYPNIPNISQTSLKHLARKYSRVTQNNDAICVTVVIRSDFVKAITLYLAQLPVAISDARSGHIMRIFVSFQKLGEFETFRSRYPVRVNLEHHGLC